MTNFEKFKNIIETTVGQEVVFTETCKNNDSVIPTVRVPVANSKNNMAANIYFDMDSVEKDPESAAKDVIDIINKALAQRDAEIESFVADITSSDKMFNISKEDVTFKLINFDESQRYLEDKLFVKVLDFALVAVVARDMSEGTATIPVTKDLAEAAKLDLDLVRDFEQISTQTIKAQGIRINTVFKELMDRMPVPCMQLPEFPIDLAEMENEPPYIVTSNTGINGATTALLGGVAKLARELDSDLYVIPSSIHELLCIPIAFLGDSAKDRSYLRDMIADVNSSCVSSTERLSDNVYIYKREGGFSIGDVRD